MMESGERRRKKKKTPSRRCYIKVLLCSTASRASACIRADDISCGTSGSAAAGTLCVLPLLLLQHSGGLVVGFIDSRLWREQQWLHRAAMVQGPEGLTGGRADGLTGRVRKRVSPVAFVC